MNLGTQYGGPVARAPESPKSAGTEPYSTSSWRTCTQATRSWLSNPGFALPDPRNPPRPAGTHRQAQPRAFIDDEASVAGSCTWGSLRDTRNRPRTAFPRGYAAPSLAVDAEQQVDEDWDRVFGGPFTGTLPRSALRRDLAPWDPCPTCTSKATSTVLVSADRAVPASLRPDSPRRPAPHSDAR